MMAEMVPVTFASSPETPADLAVRYRVLAALSSDGVSFTCSPDQLRAMARTFEIAAEIAAIPPAIVVIEREPILPGWLAVLMALSMAALIVGIAGDLHALFLGWQ